MNLNKISNAIIAAANGLIIATSLLILTACASASGYANTGAEKNALAPIGNASGHSTANSALPEGLQQDAYYYYIRAYLAELDNDLDSAVENYRRVLIIDPDSVFVGTELASLLFRLNRLDDAMQLTENLLKSNPDNLALLNMLGQAYSSRNMLDKAIATFHRIIFLEPDNSDARLHLAVLYGSVGQYEQAQKEIDIVKAIDIESAAAAMFYIGALAITAEDLDEAEALFKETEKIGFETEGVYLNLGLIWDKRGKHKQAEKYYKKTLKLNPSNLAAKEALIQLYIKTRHDKKALAMLHELALEFPDNVQILKKQALTLINMGRFAEAIGIMKKVIAIEPDDAEFRYYLGVAYEESKMYEEAIREYKKLIAASPQNIKPYLNLGYLYIQMDLYDEAEEVYTSLLEVAEPRAEYYLYLGRVFILKGEHAKAESTLSAGLDKFKDNDELHFNMAVLYEEMGRPDDLEAHLKQAIAINPEHADALNFLGYTYAENNKNLDEALELINRAIALKPDNAYIIDSLGWVYYKSGQYDKAVQALQRATQLVKNDPVMFEHLGDAYHALKQSEEARKAWENSLRILNPDELGEPDATELRQRVEGKIKKLHPADTGK